MPESKYFGVLNQYRGFLFGGNMTAEQLEPAPVI